VFGGGVAVTDGDGAAEAVTVVLEVSDGRFVTTEAGDVEYEEDEEAGDGLEGPGAVGVLE
jgi:hypothetical protein